MRRIVVGLMTGLKVSSKSIPSSWLYPLATSQALNLSTVPSGLSFVLKTHLDPMIFMEWSRGTRVHVSFWWRAFSSSFIASAHFGCFNAAASVVGSSISEFLIDIRSVGSATNFVFYLVIIECRIFGKPDGPWLACVVSFAPSGCCNWSESVGIIFLDVIITILIH